MARKWIWASHQCCHCDKRRKAHLDSGRRIFWSPTSRQPGLVNAIDKVEHRLVEQARSREGRRLFDELEVRVLNLVELVLPCRSIDRRRSSGVTVVERRARYRCPGLGLVRVAKEEEVRAVECRSLEGRGRGRF